MSRGIVMSLEGERAVVLAPGGQFVGVPRRPDYRIGDEVEFDAEELLPGKRRLARRRPLIGAVAACAAALVLVFGGLWLHTPSVVAYVSMDVNPSIELGIDGKERVRELHALNRDAEPIVAAVKFKGRDVEDVAADLAGELAARQLLSDGDSEVVLASVPVGNVDEEWEADVTDKMKRAIEQAAAQQEPAPGTTSEASPGATSEASPGATPGAAGETDPPAGETASPGAEEAGDAPEVTTLTLPKEVREEAKANGVSAGKMAFWLKAESQGYEVSLEDLKHQSLKAIASALGGVGQVLGGGASASASGSEDWSKLLEQAQKQQELKAAEQQGKTSGADASKDAGSSKGNGPAKGTGSAKNTGKGQDKKQDGKTDKETGKKKPAPEPNGAKPSPSAGFKPGKAGTGTNEGAAGGSGNAPNGTVGWFWSQAGGASGSTGPWAGTRPSFGTLPRLPAFGAAGDDSQPQADGSKNASKNASKKASKNASESGSKNGSKHESGQNPRQGAGLKDDAADRNAEDGDRSGGGLRQSANETKDSESGNGHKEPAKEEGQRN